MERHLNLSTSMPASANGALFRSGCCSTPIPGGLSAMAMLDADSGGQAMAKISEATPDNMPMNAKAAAAAPNPTGMQPSWSFGGERETDREQRFSRRRKTARLGSGN